VKLTAQHFPISCSLQSLVRDAFAGPPVEDAHVMPLDELLGYLRHPRDLDLTPYADLLSQTEAMGDPALPSPEHTAILRWIGEAMHHFEKRFPLEEPLASQVRRLKPLAAAICLLDEDFLQPDIHPLHQLLDTIQERAVGWQSRLGRAGEVLERQVVAAVDSALRWFEDDSVDLKAVCAEFLAAAQRDQARAERMSRRVVETELGKVKTAAAKREAARMINEALEKYPAPLEIGHFIKGPWYSSAQLLLLKFGADSEQWRSMAATTEALLDSVQSLDDASEERRQHIFEVVTRLPKEMRRWLLSLHHDTEAVNEAMGIVEFAHLRILRRQPVELQKITPLDTANVDETPRRPELVKALRPIVQGHWFGVEMPGEGNLRAYLVLKEETEQRLLFTNLAGMKVLDHSFEEFDALLEKKRVTALPTGSAFSLCLAIAAGVDTTEKLEALYEAFADDKEVAAADLEGAEPDAAAYFIEEDPATELQRLIENEKAKLAAESAAAAPAEAPADAADSVPGESPGEAAADGATAADGETGEPAEEALLSDAEMAELEALIGDDEPAAADAVPSAQPEPPASATGDTGDEVVDVTSEVLDSFQDDTDLERFFEEDGDAPSYFQRSGATAQRTATGHAAAPESLELPMGTWLGFHDGDKPLMAKLAVHDPDGDTYIFVNRNGIKMRELNGAELSDLLSRGLVDVLETSSSFRREVDEARKKLDT